MTLLPRRWVEKPWGRDCLPPPFTAPAGCHIGEVWFEPPAALPSLLVKYIFTSEKLSVQVHPSDAQAQSLGESDRGKEECWLVIDAEPDATLGIGFREEVDAETIRRAALDGTIEDMLVWYPVRAGDFFYIPAGTVHAIGAGVSLVEIQQNSDITYRLYDYGRPRELHLEKGLVVARGTPHDPALRRHLPHAGTVELVSNAFIVAHRCDGLPDPAILAQYAGPCIVIPRKGEMWASAIPIHPGDCAVAGSAADITFDPAGSCVLVRPA
ncbi:class I mannose-6-phosphate isomerase [Novosphingobium sp. SL115]|uniref:class I mannose-6-phosphate isomerase n=1 Tax=Novosphingobium sp. SL115 TaxID=2995150 RepID=UPI0022769ED1|nr:class I mannose-6-phosphate isomerase [Novosphingobium sp. SL115]MCY1670961.1 class I mannose-6-phosphate isomerase [Novosphingobium sp. SL115]